MQPHPRIRKTIKWGSAVVTVLLVVVWLGTGWAAVSMTYRHSPVLENDLSYTTVGVCGGGIQINTLTWMSGAFPAPGWYARFVANPFRWTIEYLPSYTATHLFIPIWPGALATMIASAVAWRVDVVSNRRDRTCVCRKCTYDRTGLRVGAACPECGTKPAATTTTTTTTS